MLTTESDTRKGVSWQCSVNKVTEFSTATSTAPSPVSDSVVSSTLPTPRGTSASNLFTFRKFLNVKRVKRTAEFQHCTSQLLVRCRL